jgi:hypothetical protein
MRFQTVRDSLIQLLGDLSFGNFRVLGYPEHRQDSRALSGLDRVVQVFYSGGEFPLSEGSSFGYSCHHVEFALNLMVSGYAECDLSVIENSNSTPSEIRDAIADSMITGQKVDESLDDLINLVYQIIMGADHSDLGDNDPVGSRWVNKIKKDPPVSHGDMVVATAVMTLTCKLEESLTGLDVTECESISMELDTGDEAQTGIETT